MKQTFLAITMFLVAAVAFAQSAPTTVILVRHAEKDTQPKDNPGLTAAGRARSEALAEMLSASDIGAIYTSQYTRTRATAEPLAAQLNLKIQQIDADNSKKLVDEILNGHAGQKVLVVGHADTVPEIIQLLGGPALPEIDERQYDNFYIVTVFGNGKTSFLQLKY